MMTAVSETTGDDALSSSPMMRRWATAAAEVARDWTADADQEDLPGGLTSLFLAYLRMHARLGVFSFGPLTIFVPTVEELARKRSWRTPGDYRALTELLQAEQQRSRRPLDELHALLALMKVGIGLPGQVFGELGVSPDRVEHWATSGVRDDPAHHSSPDLERLYSPEEAATYLGVHLGTVRNWIRSGRLPASRLAGQRAIRIKESDLLLVLDPIEPSQPTDVER